MSKIGPCQCGGYEHPVVALHKANCATLRTWTDLSFWLSAEEIETLRKASPHFYLKAVTSLSEEGSGSLKSPRYGFWTACGVEVFLALVGRRGPDWMFQRLPYDWAMLVTTTCDPRRTDGLPERLSLWAATISQPAALAKQANDPIQDRLLHERLRQELELVLMEYEDAEVTTALLARVCSWWGKSREAQQWR